MLCILSMSLTACACKESCAAYLSLTQAVNLSVEAAGGATVVQQLLNVCRNQVHQNASELQRFSFSVTR